MICFVYGILLNKLEFKLEIMEVKIQISCSVSNNVLKTLVADWAHIFYRFQNPVMTMTNNS